MSRRIRVGLVVVWAGWSAVGGTPTISAQNATLSLGLTVNDPAISPGDTLVAGITVNNPAGGPLADVFFVILLPDGTTVVSLTPGGPRAGTLANLRTLAPVVRGISLAGPFTYNNAGFFTYPFSGIEPSGLYRIFFVAARTGAFDDGAINAGDLLGVATQDITVGASPIVVDEGRRVTTTVSPAGGVVQTTGVNGMRFALSLPPDAVSVATPISVAPITSFQGRPGAFVAGISAGPSGLKLSPAATLTITLPPGFRTAGFGLRGVVTDDNGGHEEIVPVSRVGDVVTMRVSHFSVASVEVVEGLDYQACTLAAQRDDPMPPEQQAACAAIGPLAAAEFVRLEQQGGPVSPTFTAAVAGVLDTWLTTGLHRRLVAAQTVGPSVEAMSKQFAAAREWDDWASIYRALFGLGDRINQAAGRALGSKVDGAQEQLRLALLAGMNGINVLCLAQKADVPRWLTGIQFLFHLWDGQFDVPPSTPPFAAQYCVDLRIDAAPPPVVTVAQDVLFPIDVRLRFTDGVEQPGPVPALVTVTATNGTVTPAGGSVSLPLSANLKLTPTALSGTLTITAAVTDPLYDPLPSRSRTFPVGQVVPVTFSSGQLDGEIRAFRNSLLIPSFVKIAFDESLPSATVQVSQPMRDFTTFKASGNVSLSRQVGGSAAGITATMTGTLQASATGSTDPNPDVIDVTVEADDTWCVTLPRPFTVHAVVLNNASFGVDGIAMRSGDQITIGAGRRCVGFTDAITRRLSGSAQSGTGSASVGYTLTLTPVP